MIVKIVLFFIMVLYIVQNRDFVNYKSLPESTANFLVPGGDGCELRGKNALVVFLPRFFKALPRIPATRNPQPATRNRFSFFFDGGFRLNLNLSFPCETKYTGV